MTIKYPSFFLLDYNLVIGINNMNFVPVKINIKNPADFATVAYIVDRDDFLKDLYKARKRLYEIYVKKGYHGRYKTLPATNETKYLALKYKLGMDWAKTLLDILIDNKVERPHTGSVIDGEVLRNTLNIYYNRYGKIYSKETFIWVNRLTSKKELLDLYRDFKLKLNSPDVHPNVVRDRDWYWLNKNKNGYGKIAKMERDNGSPISERAVGLAIQAYKKKLNVKI